MKFTSHPKTQQYNLEVWKLVRMVPPGKVATYGQIALMLRPPAGVDFESYRHFGPRWVGSAMAACPEDVPWQRVINSQGKISVRPGAEKQRRRLEAEGLVFVRDKLDLSKYGWGGLDESEMPIQATLL